MSDNRRDAATFELDICIKNNTLIVGVNGGHVTGAPGDTVVWRATEGAPPFTLQFFRLAPEPCSGGEHKDIAVAGMQRWPFSDPPEPPNCMVGPTPFFRGTLAANLSPTAAFKYTVTAGNLQLDPIVIFDR